LLKDPVEKSVGRGERGGVPCRKERATRYLRLADVPGPGT